MICGRVTLKKSHVNVNEREVSRTVGRIWRVGRGAWRGGETPVGVAVVRLDTGVDDGSGRLFVEEERYLPLLWSS